MGILAHQNAGLVGFTRQAEGKAAGGQHAGGNGFAVTKAHILFCGKVGAGEAADLARLYPFTAHKVDLDIHVGAVHLKELLFSGHGLGLHLVAEHIAAVIKAVLRKMGAPDCGGVRAPLYNLVPEDEAQVDKCVAMIKAAYEKFL